MGLSFCISKHNTFGKMLYLRKKEFFDVLKNEILKNVKHVYFINNEGIKQSIGF
jgi:hypothetical protein